MPASRPVQEPGRSGRCPKSGRRGHPRELRGNEGRPKHRGRKQGVLGERRQREGLGARAAAAGHWGPRGKPGVVAGTSEREVKCWGRGGGLEEAGRLLLTFHELASPD